MVDLESVEVVGVPLQLHEQPAVRDVGGQAARGVPAAQLVALDPVDLAVHHVLEGVGAGAGAAALGRVPLA